MTEKLSDLVWHLEFYKSGTDGTLNLIEKVTFNGTPEVEGAVDKAKSLMHENTFPLGKANVCLIKHQDGTLVREVLI